MTTIEKIDLLLSTIRDNNTELIKQVWTLKPDDQKYYSEKVAGLIQRTKETAAGLNKKSAATNCTL